MSFAIGQIFDYTRIDLFKNRNHDLFSLIICECAKFTLVGLEIGLAADNLFLQSCGYGTCFNY